MYVNKFMTRDIIVTSECILTFTAILYLIAE